MKDKLKQLFSDSIIYGLFFILGRFLTFLLTPLYTNYLTIIEFADISNLFSYIAFLNIFYAIGFDSAFFRFYDKNNPEYSQKVFFNSWISILIISILLTVILYLNYNNFAHIICDSENSKNIILYALFIPFFDVISYVPFLYLRINNKSKQFSILKILIIFVTIILTYIFVVIYKFGALGVVYSHLIGAILAFLLTLNLIIKHLKFNFDYIILKDMLKYSLPTIPAQLSGIMLNLGDKPLVKELASNEDLAIYNANYRLGLPMMLLVLAFDYAWKPFYLNNFNEPKSKDLFARILTYLTIISSLVFLSVSFFIKEIVNMPFLGGKLINPIYWSGLDIVPIILAGYFFNGVYNNFSAGINIMKQTKYLSYSIIIAAVYNLTSNFIFIPIWGFRVAAWNTLISYMISAFVVYYNSKKIYPISYEWKRLLIIIISCLMTYFGYNILINLINIQIYINLNFLKTIFIFIFVILLYIFNFFEKSEIDLLKKFIKR